MKNKTLWFVVGAVVVLVVIVVVVMGMNKAGAPGQSGNTSGGPMSMKDLLTSGASQKCTFTNSDAQSNSSGIVYITQGHMRGDFTSVASGKTTQSHMITDGQTSYVWTDQMAQGFKMSFTSTSTSSGGSNSVNPDEKVNYACNPWSVDQGEFTLPANITFSDMGALINPGTGAKTGAGANVGTPSGNSAQCAVCVQAPTAAAQAQCKATLGCE